MSEWALFLAIFGVVVLLVLLVEGTWTIIDWLMGAVYTIDGFLPYKCTCGHWVLHKKNRLWLEQTTGRFVFLCRKCYDKEVTWNKR